MGIEIEACPCRTGLNRFVNVPIAANADRVGMSLDKAGDLAGVNDEGERVPRRRS